MRVCDPLPIEVESRWIGARVSTCHLACSETKLNIRSKPSKNRHESLVSRVVACSETAIVLSESEERFYREVGGNGVALDQAAPSDFFELLGIDESASPQEIRTAYRNIQRICHPDVAGEAATEISAILNRAYSILANDKLRRSYQDAVKAFRQAGRYDGRPISRWAGHDSETRAIFVDESVCIGCRQCTLSAPNTFLMEDDYGRARCHTQWADDEETVNEAMDLCPVTCIFLVKRTQLALLEWMMKACQRQDISTMARSDDEAGSEYNDRLAKQQERLVKSRLVSEVTGHSVCSKESLLSHSTSSRDQSLRIATISRRGGNFGPAPAMEDPFSRAEAYLRSRQDAKIPLEGSPEKLPKDVAMAGAIARAWLSLPPSLRRQGWPDW